MSHIRVRLKELIDEKAQREGRTHIPQLEIRDKTGIPQGTISRWMADKVDKLDKRLIEVFCVYLECKPGDLIIWDENGGRR